MIYPVLMACAIGERFGMTGEEMKAGIEAFVPTKMRMNVIHQGDITILDDAYNANPQSMRAALEILSQTEGAYRAAVLGDMFELGDLGPELHRSMGECAGALGNIDGLLAVGSWPGISMTRLTSPVSPRRCMPGTGRRPKSFCPTWSGRGR
ncbi:MAG: glutamate ligase domain-containing protein [Evtepia gabavorous]